MKKTIAILAVFILAIQFCVAQTLQLPTLPKGWQRIYIKNVGSFDLPPTMEVQKGKYREYIDRIKKIKGFDATQLTAQQKGVNVFEKEGLKKYARVMVETTFGSTGDFEKLNFNAAKYTQADINELNSTYKKQTQQNFLLTSLKLIEWHPLKIEKINGMSCLHISYKRQLQNKPYVLVHIYLFHNNDRMHIFTLSYRISETNYWKSDYVTILKSFRINSIK